MRKIRKGVFETNSSSVHSLTIGSSNIEKTVDLNQFEVELGSGKYGWGYEELTSWMEKADYFGVEARDSDTKRNMLETVLKMGFPNIAIEYSQSGYIDHQSRGDIWNKIESVDGLHDVIFGDSVIIISSDN